MRMADDRRVRRGFRSRIEKRFQIPDGAIQYE